MSILLGNPQNLHCEYAACRRPAKYIYGPECETETGNLMYLCDPHGLRIKDWIASHPHDPVNCNNHGNIGKVRDSLGLQGDAMKILVMHTGYGCATGCCGHMIEVDDEEVRRSFHFDHPDSKDEAIQWAKEFVTKQMGEEHVADIDWENSHIYPMDDDHY